MTISSWGDGPSLGASGTSGKPFEYTVVGADQNRHVMVTPELAAEARRCLPHVEDEGVRYLLQRIADCYPAPDEPTLPMGDGE